MNDQFSDASRRAFLRSGFAATAFASLSGVNAQTTTPPAGGTIPTPPATTPVTAPAPTAMIGTLSPSDIAIFRFSLANELIGGDLWGQYGNQVLYNPSFTAALRAIDPMLPRYVLDTVRDELSHGAFLTAMAAALGIPPVNLDPFKTLPDAGQAAATTYGQPVTDPELAGALAGMQNAGLALPPPGTPRVVNLTQLNIDTSWFNKYRTANNPDVQPDAPQLVTLQNQPTVPTTQSSGTADAQRIATAALMHMSLNEQTESSAYIALGGFLQNRELLRLMASLLPVEMMHYTAFQTSVARLQGTTDGGGTGTGSGAGVAIPDIRSQMANIPLPILPAPAPVYAGLPPVSVVRPTTLAKAGAMATAQKLVAANYFAGQPPAFTDMMMQMARAADAAGTIAALGPKNLQTSVQEVALSTAGTMSGNGALTYSVRPVQGAAAVIGGNTASPRVQFQGGYGYYTFELTVTDAAGNTSTDVATVLYTGR